MKSKAILVFLVAVFALLVLVNFVSARTLNAAIETSVNDVPLTYGWYTVADTTGSNIDVRVAITAFENLSEARIRVYLVGENNEVETGKFDLLNGRTYSKSFSLKLPETLQNSPARDFVLMVVLESNEGDVRQDYTLTAQRSSNELEVLSVDFVKSIAAGSTFNVDVVVKNRGSQESEDSFVVVRIPALDVEKKVYFGDITPIDNYGNDNDEEDAMSGRVSLKIPTDAKAGIYDVEIEAYNDETSDKVTKRVVVSGLEQGSDVLTALTTKEVAAGSTVTYDLILVNSGNRIAVYNIVPENAQNIVVSVDEPIVTVPAESSKVVKVTVKAGSVIGTYNFAVNVNSQNQLVKKVNLTANVAKSGFKSNNVVVLTIILAIIFVVLLVVLIVLLTRKPAKTEQFEESYY